jgi:hypothetical protein
VLRVRCASAISKQKDLVASSERVHQEAAGFRNQGEDLRFREKELQHRNRRLDGATYLNFEINVIRQPFLVSYGLDQTGAIRAARKQPGQTLKKARQCSLKGPHKQKLLSAGIVRRRADINEHSALLLPIHARPIHSMLA